MKRVLPPLNAIKAFESAGRLLSFSRAARELNVTQGAVSKQIKLLETFLSTALFKRSAGGISLTTEGFTYLNSIGDLLDALSSATSEMKQLPATQETLIIDVIPSFAAAWLIPKLPEFNALYTNINVEIVTGDGMVNFSNSQADCAIRCLPMQIAAKQAELLLPEVLQCLASPRLLKDKPLNTSDDFQRHKLIPQTTRPRMWHRVFEHYGLEDPSSQVSSAYEHFYLTALAAEHGLGLCLTPDFLAIDAIASGRLVNVFDMNIKTEFGYFWQAPGYKANINRVQVFYTWLKDALVQEQQKINLKKLIPLSLI